MNSRTSPHETDQLETASVVNIKPVIDNIIMIPHEMGHLVSLLYPIPKQLLINDDVVETLCSDLDEEPVVEDTSQ
jgi:hypothetical protein